MFNCIIIPSRTPAIEYFTSTLTNVGFRIGGVYALLDELLIKPEVFLQKDGPFNEKWRNMDRYFTMYVCTYIPYYAWTSLVHTVLCVKLTCINVFIRDTCTITSLMCSSIHYSRHYHNINLFSYVHVQSIISYVRLPKYLIYWK